MRAIVTVIGKDRVGIIASVTNLLSSYGVNVLDISQTVLQEYFTMIMLVDAAACSVPFAELSLLPLSLHSPACESPSARILHCATSISSAFAFFSA